jgi:N-methylhydantoinase A
VDIGGTFTDFVFYDDVSSQVVVSKIPTTTAMPERACLEAVRSSLTEQQIRSARYFLHGTTVGLNALLERKGAKVGLLATQGFRDTLEIRRGDRADAYNLFWTPPAPLVPRKLRLAVRERIRSNGEILVPLETSDVRHALELFMKEAVDSIAIAFFNSYTNPVHELEAEKQLRAAGFNGNISLSHRVSGEFKEYERTTTTVIDAFVRARMARYLGRLEKGLEDLQFRGTPLITRSGGGAVTFAEAEERSFETINSGPVAGAEGAGELSRALNLGNLITADVGGTSFDTCLITNGRPHLMYEGSIVGLPIQAPWVDVRSIGAGGGSLARIDSGGLLRVGPESAGSDPGPACYGRGGDQPTVTDAMLVLGMLGTGELASNLTLNLSSARKAIQPLAQALQYEIGHAARGIVTIAAARMGNALREISVEQGVDPRALTLLAFGGAGPLMCTLLARELSIKRIVIPPHAGNFSAWGLLGADLIRSRAQSRVMKLDELALAQANSILANLFAALGEGTVRMAGQEPPEPEAALDLRYFGQQHTLTVPMSLHLGRISRTAAEITATFEAEYQRIFGTATRGSLEIVSIRATLRAAMPRRQLSHMASAKCEPDRAQTHIAYSFTQRRDLPFRVFRRADLDEATTLFGPALIHEPTTTTYLDADFHLKSDPSGCLFIASASGAAAAP